MQNGNRQVTVFYGCALSLWAEGSPQINASTEQSPRPSGERVRVRGTYGGGGHSVHFMFLPTL